MEIFKMKCGWKSHLLEQKILEHVSIFPMSEIKFCGWMIMFFVLQLAYLDYIIAVKVEKVLKCGTLRDLKTSCDNLDELVNNEHMHVMNTLISSLFYVCS